MYLYECGHLSTTTTPRSVLVSRIVDLRHVSIWSHADHIDVNEEDFVARRRIDRSIDRSRAATREVNR